MANVDVTIASGTPFSTDDDNYIFNITATNTAEIPCAAGTYAYYVITFGENDDTFSYIFKAPDAGPIAAATAQAFVVENNVPVDVDIGVYAGVIYYTAAA